MEDSPLRPYLEHRFPGPYMALIRAAANQQVNPLEEIERSYELGFQEGGEFGATTGFEQGVVEGRKQGLTEGFLAKDIIVINKKTTKVTDHFSLSEITDKPALENIYLGTSLAESVRRGETLEGGVAFVDTPKHFLLSRKPNFKGNLRIGIETQEVNPINLFSTKTDTKYSVKDVDYLKKKGLGEIKTQPSISDDFFKNMAKNRTQSRRIKHSVAKPDIKEVKIRVTEAGKPDKETDEGKKKDKGK